MLKFLAGPAFGWAFLLCASASFPQTAPGQVLSPKAARHPSGDAAVKPTESRTQTKPPGTVAELKETLDTGSLREKQNAFAALATLPGPAADELCAQWLDKLLARRLPPELHLDLFEAAEKRDAPAIKEKLRQFESGRDPKDALRHWRECLTGGDAAAGRKIFFEKPEVQCVRCHKAGQEAEGGEVGPNLTGIGARQTREYLLESIVLPNQRVAAGYESLIVTMKNGVAYGGVLKSESNAELELNSPEDGLLKLNKAEIRSRERGPSAMPEELRQVLGKRELRDLVEFLSGLR
jgi:quinoprotein glucose dehydrogenase